MRASDYNSNDEESLQESEWLDLAEISISTGEMIIVDPIMYPDGFVVHLRPGTYRIQIVILTEEGSQKVSKLRAYSEKDHVVGNMIGKASAEFARIGIGDKGQIDKHAVNTEEQLDLILQALETEKVYGTASWNKELGVEMPFVNPADGDGWVHELLHGRTRVGIQVEFHFDHQE